MTEQEWLECTDPTPMLEFLRETGSERKLRLFASACCRRIWHFLVHEVSRGAVQVAERCADGLTSEDEQYEAFQAAVDVRYQLEADFDVYNLKENSLYADTITNAGLNRYAASVAAEAAVSSVEGFGDGAFSGPAAYICAAEAVGRAYWKGDRLNTDAESDELSDQAALIRDVFSNPFRPISINPSWLTLTVLSLAQTAYEERIMPSGELDPERLAVLSDALEEAGCDREDILEHLRSAGPHVRGCWAVDLILGKK
jgi:hypothetical protein